ncbi:hypothetical protein ACIP2X_38160 [Streptomyces sp. NPDC089424]|uniref:hypothetical protein n=1 Tax=Streptomyces sp. NPDC089424 TaxID=3365917 RepID=UPI00381E7BAF
MTIPSLPSLALEEQAAQNAWDLFLRGYCVDADARHLKAWITAWSRTTTGTGVVVSARVHGPDAVDAVRRFSVANIVKYADRGANARPFLDYGVPGRVACVWQSGGVWVELWHPDTTAAPVPVSAPSRPAERRPLTGPGGRLKFGRRNKTKETRTA